MVQYPLAKSKTQGNIQILKKHTITTDKTKFKIIKLFFRPSAPKTPSFLLCTLEHITI